MTRLSDPFDPAFLQAFGISRLGDITGLDTLGIPVWFAVRPNARSLSVSQGKGLSEYQAKISAVMESIEGAVAEQTRQHVVNFASINDMERSGGAIVPLAELARVHAAKLDRDAERAWVEGRSLVTGAPVSAPYELVGLDMRMKFPWDRESFQMTSQGLGAHFDRDLALRHALLELTEQDGSVSLDMFGLMDGRIREVTGYEGADARLDAALALLRSAGQEMRFLSLPGRFGLPVIAAVMSRKVGGRSGQLERTPGGTSCRLTIHDAMVSALLEAAQSRLTDIAGSRDDIPADRYRKHSKGMITQSCKTISLSDLQKQYAQGPVRDDPDWRQIVDKLLAAGAGDVWMFDLKTPVEGVHVVRVLASGLEASGGIFDEIPASSFLFRPESMGEPV
ncbi:YcaO-like family protein [Roseibium sp. RKSG952]|uniref:YcaO-like family protein n=1 Tax=Roseibium sp. RKSG952 TaxID=2529384 RepID=UPI0012BC6239|nr:YcaO-like family protein [Roseibium sp. RKSG952]MTI00380.1 hypothetical protein [Roseibium sp. RKSG952]